MFNNSKENFLLVNTKIREIKCKRIKHENGNYEIRELTKMLEMNTSQFGLEFSHQGSSFVVSVH